MDHFEENISDAESIDSSDEKIEKIKKTFKIDDFLKCAATKKILVWHHLEKFSTKTEPELKVLYQNIKLHCDQQMSSALRFDKTSRGMGMVIGLVYKFIKKEYDLEIFENKPELANPLIAEYEKKNNKKIYI